MACLIWFMVLGVVLADLDPIMIKGSHFFYESNQTEFFIRGIAYQDPNSSRDSILLADTAGCNRDIPFLKRLNVNLVDVGYVDTTKDISGCMKAFEDADIYVLASLTHASHYGINDNVPWTTAMMAGLFAIVDLFAVHAHTFGFINNDVFFANHWPYQKAIIRDTNQYIRDKQYRRIPIGFNIPTPDESIGQEVLWSQVDFMTCTEIRADFVAIDLRASDSTDSCQPDPKYFLGQKFEELAGNIYSRTQLPAFTSNYGCHTDRHNETLDNRTYSIVTDFFNAEASEFLSGAIAYEYFQRDSLDLGLISIISPSRVTEVPGFTALSSALAQVEPNATLKDQYVPGTNTPVCPTIVSRDPVPTKLPPAPNREICGCMMDTLRCTTTPSFTYFMGHPELERDARYAENPLSGPFLLNLTLICENKTDTLCPGIWIDGEKDTFGAFSMCNHSEVYSWAANQRWKRHGDKGCDINGTVQLRDLPTQSRNATQCAFYLDQLDENGAGTISLKTMATTTSTPVSWPSVRPGPSVPQSKSKKDFSAPAKIGTGVGVSIFTIVTLLLLLIALRRRHRKRERALSDVNSTRQSQIWGKKELDGVLILEVEASHKPVEICSKFRDVAELPSGAVAAVELPVT